MTIENVVQNWLALIVEDELFAHEGLELAVGRCLGLFYAGNVMVGSRDPEWLQVDLNVLIGLLQLYGLVWNISKYKSKTCQPKEIRYGILEEAVG